MSLLHVTLNGHFTLIVRDCSVNIVNCLPLNMSTCCWVVGAAMLDWTREDTVMGIGTMQPNTGEKTCMVAPHWKGLS